MNNICVYCQGRRFDTEPNGICCSNGKIILQHLIVPPETLKSYITGETIFFQNNYWI